RRVVYEDGYVRALDGEDSFTDRGLRRLAHRLRRVQDALAARGIAFALVIAPNKAAVYPEFLPAGFLHPEDVRPPAAYDRMRPMLAEEGVHVVDGRAILLAEKGRSDVPLFPPGGVHWNRYAAHLVVDQLFAELG